MAGGVHYYGRGGVVVGGVLAAGVSAAARASNVVSGGAEIYRKRSAGSAAADSMAEFIAASSDVGVFDWEVLDRFDLVVLSVLVSDVHVGSVWGGFEEHRVADDYGVFAGGCGVG